MPRMLDRDVIDRSLELGDLIYGVDPETKELAADSIEMFKEKFIVPNLPTGGITTEAVTRAIDQAVEDWALANLDTPVEIPFDKIDADGLLRYLERQENFPRAMEVLITPKAFAFDAHANTRLTLDVGETLPSSGMIRFTISDPSDSKDVYVDAAALHALNDATESINWRDPDDPPDANSILHVRNAVSQDEDGVFNLGFLIGKNFADGNNFVLVQLDHNTTLNRTVGAEVLETFSVVTDGEVVGNTLKFYKRTGDNKSVKVEQLPHTTVTPDTAKVEPPDEFLQDIFTHGPNWQTEPGAKIIPLEGGFEVDIGLTKHNVDAFTFENLRSKTPATAGDAVGVTDDAYGILVPGTDIRIGWDGQKPLVYTPTVDGSVIVESHARLVYTEPDVLFDLTIVASSSNRMRWTGGTGSVPYDPDNDGDLDLFLDGEELEDDLSPHEVAEFIRVSDGDRETSVSTATGKGETISDKGVVGIDAGNLFYALIFRVSDGGVANGTSLHFEIKKQPVQYIVTGQFVHLWQGQAVRHPAVFPDGDTYRTEWRREDMVASVQASLDKADATLRFARDASVKVPVGQIPPASVVRIDSAAELNQSYDGVVFLVVTGAFDYGGKTYKVGDVYVATGDTTRVDITEHISTSISDLPAGTSVDKVLVRGKTKRHDIVLRFVQVGNNFRWGNGLGEIVDSSTLTDDEINEQWLGAEYIGSSNNLVMWTKDPAVGGDDWDDIYFAGVRKSLDGNGQGEANVPWTDGGNKRGLQYTVSIDSGDAVTATSLEKTVNTRDDEADDGDQFFGGNPFDKTFYISLDGLQALVSAGVIHVGSAFPVAPIVGQFHIQDSDVSNLSYLDGDGNAGTIGKAYDLFQYRSDSHWHLEARVSLPSVASWALVGNTDILDRAKLPGPVETLGALPSVSDRSLGSLVSVGGELYELSNASGANAWVELLADYQRIGTDLYPSQRKATYGSGTKRRYQTEEITSESPKYFTLEFSADNWVERPRFAPAQGPTLSQSYLPATGWYQDDAGNRVDGFPGGLHNVIFHPHDYVDHRLRDRVTFDFFRNRKREFDPLSFLFYLNNEAPADQRTYALVNKAGSQVIVQTSIALAAKDKPIDGAGNRRTITGQAELVNVDGNYLSVRGGSDEQKYSDEIGRDVRWREIYRMSANDWALVRNYRDQSWLGDQFANPLNLSNIPDGVLLRFALQQGTRTRLLHTFRDVLSQDIKALAAMGSSAHNLADDRNFNSPGVPELSIVEGYELMDHQDAFQNHGTNANCFRMQIRNQSRTWGSHWVGNGNMYVGFDHVSYWTAGSQLIVYALGY